MGTQWIIIGISGVTCGGKTYLTEEMKKLLPGIEVMTQDTYFYPEDSDKHTFIPELNHFNWEILSSLDMEKMHADILKTTSNNLVQADTTSIFDEFMNKRSKESKTKTCRTCLSKNDIHSIQNQLVKHNIKLLILDGFTLFNYEPIDQICHLKFYLTLSYETCFSRRKERNYIPPDKPGYFENCVWPEHLRHIEEIKNKCKNIYFSAEDETKKCPVVIDYLDFFLSKL